MAGTQVTMRRRRLLSTVLLATLVATASLVTARVQSQAGADPIAGLQAEAATISQKLVLEQLEVGAYQQQYSVDSARVAGDRAALAQLGRQISVDNRAIATRMRLVSAQAIRSYTDYGTGTSGAAALFSGSEEHAQAASEYSSIAAGDITSAVDDLHTAQRALQAQEVALQRQEAQDQTDLARQATSLSQAQATAAQLSATQAQVTGQLATAVAQQAAIQSAAAVRAVARAQQAVARSASTRTTSATADSGAPAAPTSTAPAPTGAGAGGGATTDPALPPFLQCVVQAESGGDYQAVSPNGLYMGAFQFSQPTWNYAARAAGLPGLVGVHPNLASKASQDTVAVALYALDGEQPWLGDRCS
jgi:hypothetical protein